MTIQMELGMVVTLSLAFLGFLFGAGKMLLAQIDRRQSERDAKQEAQINTLLTQIAKEAESVHQLERDFLKFQADLPLSYVRREDYVRNQTVIEAKLDAVALKIENIQLKGTHQ
ncbi:hypothetical protein [Chromobacterium piscinae]|uniref:hypothetical protein n=1 Tax=Chromobacterium piscinae TaxID=686831 RepID=UPI003F7E439A|nr:Uncharacterized protein ChrSW_1957 [Chromobacterium vaccinii]QND89415.1 Uncharacterized protein ChrSV_1957 [Chromobacterium vaccinii]